MACTVAITALEVVKDENLAQNARKLGDLSVEMQNFGKQRYLHW